MRPVLAWLFQPFAFLDHTLWCAHLSAATLPMQQAVIITLLEMSPQGCTRSI